jgi:hypothetical protein
MCSRVSTDASAVPCLLLRKRSVAFLSSRARIQPANNTSSAPAMLRITWLFLAQ